MIKKIQINCNEKINYLLSIAHCEEASTLTLVDSQLEKHCVTIA